MFYLQTEGRRELALERAARLEIDYRRAQRTPRSGTRLAEAARADRLHSILRPRRPLIRTQEEDRPCAA